MTRRVLAGVAICAWALALARTRAFTLPADALTAVAIVAGGVLGWRLLRGLEPRPWPRGGIWLWGALALAVAAFELLMLFHGPRSAYPTISSLTNRLAFGHAWGRPVFGLLWLAIGGYLLRCARTS
jgi:zinc transporter ZupT